MKDLFFSSFSEQIGFTLLHSLWQGIIGVVLILGISRIINTKYSSLRYWLFVSVMLLVFTANLFTFSSYITNSQLAEEANPIISFTRTLAVSQLLNLTTTGSWSSNFQLAIPYLVMLWWLGILGLFIRMSINLWQVRRLSTTNHLPVSAGVMDLFKQLKIRLKINNLVRIVQSKQILVPCIIGHFKPIILLPIGLVSGLESSQVEAILLHELSHIKRHDYLVNIIQSMIEVLYFFNPFIWLISKAIRDEREHASDDKAISLGISAPEYAQTLASVYNYAINRQEFTMSFASRNKLTLKRIQRIMKTQTNNNNKLIVTMIFVIAISLSIYFGAQSQAPGPVSDTLPNRTEVAMFAPVISLPSVPVLELIKEKPVFEKIPPPPIVKLDTIKPKELKKRAEAYERAMEGLKATKEWQEVERLRVDMAMEKIHYLKELEPIMEKVLRMAEQNIEIDAIKRIAIEEHLAMVEEVMANVVIDLDIQEAMEINMKAIEESVRHMQLKMVAINIEEMKHWPKSMLKKLKSMRLRHKWLLWMQKR